MDTPDFDGMARAYGATREPEHRDVRVKVLYPHIPAALARARWWLAHEGRVPDDAATFFPDAWYPPAVTLARRTLLPSSESEQRSTDVTVSVILARIDSEMQLTETTTEVGRYLDILSASEIERAVVITMIRTHIDELKCCTSEAERAIHSWIRVFLDRNIVEIKHPSIHTWTDDTTKEWVTEFKKKFTAPEAYLSASRIGVKALFRLARQPRLWRLTVHGVGVLLRNGIDPAAVDDGYGRTVLWIMIIGIISPRYGTWRRFDMLRRILEAVHAMYAEFPEFKFSALLNTPDDYGSTLSDLIQTVSQNNNLVLYVCSWGLNVPTDIHGSDVWRNVSHLLAETRPIGVPDTAILAMVRHAAQVSNACVKDVCAVPRTFTVTRNGVTVDLGATSNISMASLELLLHFVRLRRGYEETVNEVLFVLNAILCYPSWSHQRHKFFGENVRERVTTVLLVARRLDHTVSTKCGRLPQEMWYAILAFIRDNRVTLP